MLPKKIFIIYLNRQVLFLIFLLLICSCSDFIGNNTKEKLPQNSITKLLIKRDTSLTKLIQRADDENLEFSQGFRELKINNRIQDLDFTGWEALQDEYSLANGIQKFKNEIDLDFVDGDSIYEVTLTFLRDSLKTIRIADPQAPFKGINHYVIPLLKEKLEIVYGSGQKDDDSISDYNSIADLLTAEEALPYTPAVRRVHYEDYSWESKNYALDSWYHWVYLRVRQPSGLSDYEIESVRVGLEISESKTKNEISGIESRTRSNKRNETEKKKWEEIEERKKEKLKRTVESF